MKRGSALLIVLGMVSFMLFSGIAFSVYMRQTRLPSTFLRRTTVTRQLAKAALAEAINDIDVAIGNNPHPNVRSQADNTASSAEERASQTGNYWNHRVLVKYRADAENSDGYTDGDTISTLTLEGLAYLPPSLINEVRYFSRRTQTAKWQRFRFDAGRYAYCAIDVSDYFDVNRLLADYPRASASSRRVTLAHMFEKSGTGGLHGKVGDGEARAWDEWLAQEGGVRKVKDNDSISFNGTMPLVSLADFNLYFSSKSFGNIKSPFIKYLDDPANGGFYADASANDADAQAEAYRSMTFVTDSLFREPTTSEKDIENVDNQPFELADLHNKGRTTYLGYDDVYSKGADAPEIYENFLGRTGLCLLYDYLDENSVPVSLALPTVEKVPMICAIKPSINDGTIKFKVTKGAAKDESGTDIPTDGSGPPAPTEKRTVIREDVYAFDAQRYFSAVRSRMSVQALYPFIHEEDVELGRFSIDGKLALYFTVDGDDLELNSKVSVGGFGLAKNVSDGNSSDWSGDAAYVTVSGLKFTTDHKNDDGTHLLGFKESPFGNLRNLASSFDSGSHCLFRIKRSWTQHVDINPITQSRTWPDGKENLTTDTEDITIVDNGVTGDIPVLHGENGGNSSRGKRYTNDELAALLQDGSKSLKLNVAYWLRIRDSKQNNAVVDLVPASIADDQVQLGVSISRRASQFATVYGSGAQLLQFSGVFDGGQTLSPWTITDGLEKKITFDCRAIMVSDPRYNHSPLNWFDPNANSGDELSDVWLRNYACSDGYRDPDLTMAVSDQGYLQSVYELAFLSRVSDPTADSGGTIAPNVNNMAYGNGGWGDPPKRRTFATSARDTWNYSSMWRTYYPYAISNKGRDPFVETGLIAGLRGIKVNPYSDSMEVLSSAFVNTPLDWSHASTNATMNQYSQDDADTFNKEYAWNAYNEKGAKLMWNDLQGVAETFYDAMRDEGKTDWEAGYQALNWSANKDEILKGVKLDGSSSDLYSVDKKFLYGFWHDSFAVNQQLFLVFVRAEPMMMGGGVAGNAPPQLSSRAVALVWRDPKSRKNVSSSSKSGTTDYVPHAMRILFYHPLD